MIGALAGDIIGSTREFHPVDDPGFELFPHGSKFTDDSVLSVATADALLHGLDYAATYKEYAKYWPGRGYGSRFRYWVMTPGAEPYNSFGNGSAMRVAPVGWFFDTMEATLLEARRSAEVTHNHPEGIKGAEAVAAAIFMARQRAGKVEMRKFI